MRPGRGPSASSHVDAAERLVEARGKRLSLESASIPRQQYDVLHALSAVLVVAYAYLTLDKAPPPHALGAFLGADGVHFDGSIGVRVLFSFIVGALTPRSKRSARGGREPPSPVKFFG